MIDHRGPTNYPPDPYSVARAATPAFGSIWNDEWANKRSHRPSGGAGMVTYGASSSMTRPAKPGSPRRAAPNPTKAGCRSPQPSRARTQKTRPWVPHCLQDLSRRSRRKGRLRPRLVPKRRVRAENRGGGRSGISQRIALERPLNGEYEVCGLSWLVRRTTPIARPEHQPMWDLPSYASVPVQL